VTWKIPKGLITDGSDLYNWLSWQLLTWRILYYYPDYCHKKRLRNEQTTDAIYDAAERLYGFLAEKLDLPDHILTKVQVDFTRPIVKMMVATLGQDPDKFKKERNDLRSLGLD